MHNINKCDYCNMGKYKSARVVCHYCNELKWCCAECLDDIGTVALGVYQYFLSNKPCIDCMTIINRNNQIDNICQLA